MQGSELQASGFRVLGLRVKPLNPSKWLNGCRVQGAGFKGSRVQGSEVLSQGAGFRVLGSPRNLKNLKGFKGSGIRVQVSGSKGSGFRASGFRFQGAGCRVYLQTIKP